MARRTVVLREPTGADRTVEIGDGFAVVDDTAVPTALVRPAQIRAGGRTLWGAADGDMRWVFLDGEVFTFQVQAAGARARARHAGGLGAPMPATVTRIVVSEGQHVRAGDILILLEAMKMELPVRAPADGVISSVRCREGELVQPGVELIEMTEVT
jgi:acetyl/propionyl-CoA carboxylase alpha subunit